MKKKIFLCGKVKELDFAKPELFELEMRRDVTVFLKQKNVPSVLKMNTNTH